jgi:hypothetical protein
MRRSLVVAFAALAGLSACHRRPAEGPKPPAAPGSGPASAAAPAALPARAPGLWEQKVSSAGRSQTSRICLDKAVERRFTWWGQHAHEGACSKAQITPRAGGGWDFASSCDMGADGKTSTKGTVTGDMARSYRLEATSTISGARAAEMNGTHAMTLEASWQGPCPAGMQPGDVILPGGMKINMMKLPAG